MKNIKRLLLPSLYIGVIGVMIISVLLVISGIKSYITDKPKYNYALDGVFESDIMPVIKNESGVIVRPYLNDNIKIGKYYYDYKSSDSKKQENSLVLYKNTYMQNKGVNYVSNEEFDVLSVLDGEVTSIEDNDVYGKIITITHNENLKTVYSNVKELLVAIGYKVSSGELIAKSDISKLDNNNEYMLHFETYYKDNTIDPEKIYSSTLEDLDKMD